MKELKEIVVEKIKGEIEKNPYPDIALLGVLNSILATVLKGIEDERDRF